MARYAPAKLFQASGLSTTDDMCIYQSPTTSETILKQLIITNTGSASATVGISLNAYQWNMLEPADAFNASNPTPGGIGGWTATNASLSYASPYLQVTCTAAGSVGVQLALYSSSQGAGPLFAVSPSTNYTLVGYHRTAATGRSIAATVIWYTSTGLYVSYNTLYTYTDTTSLAAQSGTVTAPPTAAYAAIQFVYATMAVNEVHDINNIAFYLTASGGTVPQTRTFSRIFPDMSVAPGITVLDLSTVMNPGDFISAKASAAGVNIYGSGVTVQ